MLERVAIYFKDNNSRTKDGVDRLVDEFSRRGIRIRIYQKLLDENTGSNWEIIRNPNGLTYTTELPDLVLSVGGDGTFLETVLKVKDMGIPIAGVNTGRMGF